MTTKAKEINEKLRAIMALGVESHAAGDTAAATARAAKDRRTERKWQSTNKACRATGTACEASLMLAQLVAARVQKSAMPDDVKDQRFLSFVESAAMLVDDLNFEAASIAGLRPEPVTSKSKPKRRT